jgi:predicted permease
MANTASNAATSVLFTLVLGKLLMLKLPKGGQHGAAIKDLVLSALLPASIFLSLLHLPLSISALAWPLAALACNLASFFFHRLVLSVLLPPPLRPSLTAICLELCSFSPGLSSFAFILEFASTDTRGLVGFADFGNKVYGIIISKGVCLALFSRMHAALLRTTDGSGTSQPPALLARSAIGQLVCEPITAACILGVALASARIAVEDLGFVGASLEKVRGRRHVPMMCVGRQPK